MASQRRCRWLDFGRARVETARKEDRRISRALDLRLSPPSTRTRLRELIVESTATGRATSRERPTHLARAVGSASELRHSLQQSQPAGFLHAAAHQPLRRAERRARPRRRPAARRLARFDCTGVSARWSRRRAFVGLAVGANELLSLGEGQWSTLRIEAPHFEGGVWRLTLGHEVLSIFPTQGYGGIWAWRAN